MTENPQTSQDGKADSRRTTNVIRRVSPLKRKWIKPKKKRHRELWRSGRVILDGPETGALRLRIFERAEWRCEWKPDEVNRCTNGITWESMIMHHVIFRSHGGPDTEENCVGICKSCDDSIHPGPQWSKS